MTTKRQLRKQVAELETQLYDLQRRFDAVLAEANASERMIVSLIADRDTAVNSLDLLVKRVRALTRTL